MPPANRTVRAASQSKRSMISVVIADSHPVVLYGLAALLEHEADFDVVARCKEGDAALAASLKYSPSMALLDLNLPKLPGLEVVAAVSKQLPATRIVIFASSREHRGALVAARRGAHGIIMKETR